MTPLLAQRPRPDRSFERLYRRHVGDVYRYALALMRNQADAEDVTQTTFMNAYRAFQRGERPEKPVNWLIAITHNVCRQRFRQSARRPKEVGLDDDVGAQLVEPDDDTPSGEDIRRALGHLAFNQRAALVMRELEGRSYAEIGEILELSPSAVETLIFRARRALREQLESSLTCGEAELAISRQLDGRLTRRDKGALRAHLRECKQCASFARRQRAQRAALRSLGAVPVPSSLLSLFGGGSTAGTALALKAAAAVAIGAIAGGAGYEGYEGVRHVVRTEHRPAAVHTRAARPAPAAAAAPSGAVRVSRVVRARGVVAAAHARPAERTLHAGAGPAAAAHARKHARRTHVHRVQPAHRAQPTHPAAPPHPSRPLHRARPTHVRQTRVRTHPLPPPHPPRPVTRHSQRSSAPAPPPRRAPVRKQLPGPYDAGTPAPEPAHGNGK